MNTGSLTMPVTVADPKRSLDSEQISPATIAHHTEYEKTPNLHQSYIFQWGAQPYLVDPLSRLVGKPPFSPWLSKNVLPLKKAANGPNSATSLTQTFDRILFCVYNSLYFERLYMDGWRDGLNRLWRDGVTILPRPAKKNATAKNNRPVPAFEKKI